MLGRDGVRQLHYIQAHFWFIKPPPLHRGCGGDQKKPPSAGPSHTAVLKSATHTYYYYYYYYYYSVGSVGAPSGELLRLWSRCRHRTWAHLGDTSVGRGAPSWLVLWCGS